ncbi:MAG: acyl-CoA dehydrogenase family protein [Phycisphaerae bacterium]|nr:acyl-CoA dehydrogenase family protein [Phycisphaerae bacterium]
MANYYDDNEDLRFYVERSIDWERLVELTEYKYRAADGFTNASEAVDFYRSILEMVGDFSANQIATLAQEIDRQHPRLENGRVEFPPVLEDIFERIRQLELHGMCLPRELGGVNCPFVVFMLSMELLARAEVSVAAHVGFHGGMALVMLILSILEGTTEFDTDSARIKSTRFGEAIGEIISGKAWGSMDITEPGAGSDMAALRTRGEQDAEGNWYVTGQKIFITSGHAKYHFVIARTEKPAGDDAFAGLKGLSLFLVPTRTGDGRGERVPQVRFDALEEKLGHHGSATVAASFDRAPAHLIGRRGDGFKLMLLLMNSARVGVGFESLGICEAAWRMAKAYAAERGSMGKTIDRHEMIADYLDEMRTDIQGIRAVCVDSACHEETAHKLDILLNLIPPETEAERRGSQAEIERHRRASRRLTPLVKYLAAEKAVEMSRRCVQIHGGYGYSIEYGAEKLLRDAMVLPIYEGTSQIQALMAMKDNLTGILKRPGAFLRAAAGANVRRWFGNSRRHRRVAGLQTKVNATLRFLLTRLAIKKLSETRTFSIRRWMRLSGQWDPKKDFALALLHAERLTRMLADVAVCETLLAQAERFPERGEVLDRYLERAEPRCRFLRSEITGTGKRLLDLLATAESDEQSTSR